jgi:FlaA1/EpsC-like NDP-sugar epimerase
LKKRVQRFVQAEESREVVSHQLAGIEDVLRLTHEQSIAIRDPEVVSRQLDALTAEVAATEETVREMEQFMQVTEEFSSTSSLPSGRERVR